MDAVAADWMMLLRISIVVPAAAVAAPVPPAPLPRTAQEIETYNQFGQSLIWSFSLPDPLPGYPTPHCPSHHALRLSHLSQQFVHCWNWRPVDCSDPARSVEKITSGYVFNTAVKETRTYIHLSPVLVVPIIVAIVRG